MNDPATPDPNTPLIEVHGLTMKYGEKLIQKDLNFKVRKGEIFIIMGGSGCGKSTLLKHIIGLIPPYSGRILFHGKDLWASDEAERQALIRNFGVLYQSGALWSSMSLSDNIALPLREYTRLSEPQIREIVEYKLGLVGLAGTGDLFPSEISGGMRKRAGLARAMALDPELLLLDEPSAGLDPVSSRLLDELVLELRASLDATIVVVTHELASIFAIGDNSIFLDAERKTAIASGNPRELLAHSPESAVQQFLSRGERSKRQEAGVAQETP